ncbi:MAG: TolC family protein [Methylomonas sp.]
MIIAIWLAGCAEFHPQPVSPADNAARFDSRGLDGEELRQSLETKLNRPLTPWPPEAWDLRLLTMAALFYHPDMVLAKAQYQLAEAAEITAAQRPNPAMSFSPTYVSNITSPPFNPYVLGLIPDIPIETAGKRDKRLQLAQNLTESARYKIAAAAWSVRSRLRGSLLNLYAARRTVTIRDRQYADQSIGARLLEARQQAGEIGMSESNAGKLARQQSRLNLLEAQRQSAESTARLADALGVPANALQSVELALADFERLAEVEPESIDAIRRQALFNRADLLTALSDYEASQSALQLEVAKQYPDVRLGPGIIFNQGEYKWVFGVTLTLPILNQNQGPIAEAEARRKESAARVESLQAKMAAELEISTAALAAARQKLASADDLLATQMRQSQTAEALFKAGETDRLAWLTSRADYATAELARLDALVKAQQAAGLLEDAMQKPLDEPLNTFKNAP